MELTPDYWRLIQTCLLATAFLPLMLVGAVILIVFRQAARDFAAYWKRFPKSLIDDILPPDIPHSHSGKKRRK